MSKCEICNRGSDHYYNKKHLCKYHYWIERGRPKNESWWYIWKEYRYSHPVRVARWREQDKDLEYFFGRL